MDEKQAKFISDLMKENLDTMTKVTYRKTGNDEHKTEDLVQSVLTIACLKVNDLMDHPQPAAWLYTTLNHLFMNEQRRASRRYEVDFDEYHHGSRPGVENELPLERLLPDGRSADEREMMILRFQYDIALYLSLIHI